MTQVTQSEIEFYDMFWNRDEACGHVANMERVEEVLNRIVAGVKDIENPSVLDVGCGNGWMLHHLQEQLNRPAKLYGVEPSNAGTSNTRSKVPGATIWQGTLEDVDPELRVNAIICSEVIEHVDDQSAFVGMLADRLLPGGFAVLTTDNGDFHEAIMEFDTQNQPREDHLSVEALRSVCAEHFEIEEFVSFNLALYLKLHPILRTYRKFLYRLPKLWRRVESIDRKLLNERVVGRYLVVTLRRPA